MKKDLFTIEDKGENLIPYKEDKVQVRYIRTKSNGRARKKRGREMRLQEQIIQYVDQTAERWIQMSHAIHSNPEVGNEEYYASSLLINVLEEAGFDVERDIAGHQTGFIATKTSGKAGTTIGYLAEYDALQGLGHACGHNMIGVSSVAAAIALGRCIEEVGGSVKVFGSPAEEGGVNGSAKASYAKAGIFEGTDVAMMVHPSSYTQRSSTAIAVAPIDFEFFGKPAHASAMPEEGINALDAMILFYNGINALRQQVTSDVRIHGVILNGGEAANIIPDYTKARFYLRAATAKKLEVLIEKVYRIADGAASMTGCHAEYKLIQNVVEDLAPNKTLDEVFAEQMENLGEHVEEEILREVGSTDTGNVSHVIPTIQPTISISECPIAAHTETFREAAVSVKADKGVILSAKALALTGLKILTDKEMLEVIKKEFEQREK